jgi:hypothetical protein
MKVKRDELMKVKTKVKASETPHHHNKTLVRDAAQARGLKVKTGVKAGATGGDSGGIHVGS